MMKACLSIGSVAFDKILYEVPKKVMNEEVNPIISKIVKNDETNTLFYDVSTGQGVEYEYLKLIEIDYFKKKTFFSEARDWWKL